MGSESYTRFEEASLLVCLTMLDDIHFDASSLRVQLLGLYHYFTLHELRIFDEAQINIKK